MHLRVENNYNFIDLLLKTEELKLLKKPDNSMVTMVIYNNCSRDIDYKPDPSKLIPCHEFHQKQFGINFFWDISRYPLSYKIIRDYKHMIQTQNLGIIIFPVHLPDIFIEIRSQVYSSRLCEI